MIIQGVRAAVQLARTSTIWPNGGCLRVYGRERIIFGFSPVAQKTKLKCSFKSPRSARDEGVSNNKARISPEKVFPSFARDRTPIQNTKQLSGLRSHAHTSCTRDTTGSIEELGSYFLALLIDSSRGLTTNERADAAPLSLAREYPSGCDVLERHVGGVFYPD